MEEVKVRFGRGAKPLYTANGKEQAIGGPPPVKVEGPKKTQDDLEIGELVEEEEVISFGSTKGKQVAGNVGTFGVVVPQRKFDQYLHKNKRVLRQPKPEE